jgi:hypothetical protein
VTDRGQHLADDTLSSLVDQQLTHAELADAQSHVQSCPECQARLNGLGSVVGLLRGLPSIDLPRDFRLAAQPSPAADLGDAVALEAVPGARSQLRVLIDPPNVIRLRRWYSVARAGAASLAAAFVFLSVGALYVDSQPVSSTATGGLASSQDASSKPVAVPAASPPAAAAAPQSARGPAAQSAPAAPNALVPAAGAGAAARPRNGAPAANDTAADQTAAATSVRALPTPLPTPVPPRLPVSQPPVTAPVAESSAAALRTAAAVAGILAALGLLLTLVVRHRLKAATLTTE